MLTTSLLVLALGAGGCDLTCDDNELEPCGQSGNDGGCAFPLYGEITCGGTICGTVRADGGSRDTDWFLFDVVENGTVIAATLTSEFPGVCFVVAGAQVCMPTIIGQTGCSDGCGPIADAGVVTLDAGTYAVFVSAGNCDGSGVFDGFPCGASNVYTVTLSCDPPCAGDVTGDGQVNVEDLTAVILAWGNCPGCPADVTGNGVVDVEDLSQVILGWGACSR